jgi:pentatricopeptide repeat protein
MRGKDSVQKFQKTGEGGEAPSDMDSLKAAVQNADSTKGCVRDIILSSSFQMRATGFTSLLQTCNRQKSWKKALEVFETMQEVGVSANTYTYSALVSALGSAGQWEKVRCVQCSPLDLLLIRAVLRVSGIVFRLRFLTRGATVFSVPLGFGNVGYGRVSTATGSFYQRPSVCSKHRQLQRSSKRFGEGGKVRSV